MAAPSFSPQAQDQEGRGRDKVLLLGSSCHQPSRPSGQLPTPNLRLPEPFVVLVVDGLAMGVWLGRKEARKK